MMNHRKKPFLLSCVALALLIGAPGRLHAQPASDVTMPLSFTLAAAVQQPDVVSGANSQLTKHSTKAVKWTTKNLMSLIATNLGVSFTNGETLVLAGGSPTIIDKQGNTTDVSSLLTVDTGDGTSVTTGLDNSDTGAFNDTSSTYVTITFDDGNGNNFTLAGLARIVSASTATSDSQGNSLNATETYSISFTGPGYGNVGGNAAVFTGTVSGKGTFKQSST